MSTSEILDQLSLLAPSEREKVWQRLEELELAQIEETRRCSRPSTPGALRYVRAKLTPWSRPAI
jgi:hypothetical protein